MSDEALPAGDYFLEIEAHFAQRRGTPFILSAKDWALMKEWSESGVPLPVVIEAIDQVFENNEASGRRKTISSLTYCKHAIREIWNERKQMHVGSGQSLPEEDPAPILEQLAASVEAVSQPVADSIRQLEKERSVPVIENKLIELEQQLMAECLSSMDPFALQSLREEVVRSLGDTSRLDEATRLRTEEANLRRLVRERFGLPRLSLF